MVSTSNPQKMSLCGGPSQKHGFQKDMWNYQPAGGGFTQCRQISVCVCVWKSLCAPCPSFLNKSPLSFLAFCCTMSLSESPSNDRSWPQFSPEKKNDFPREWWLLAIYLPTETNMGATSRAQNIPLPTSVRIGRLGSAILAYKTSTSSLTLCHMPATPSATHGKVFHNNPVITLYLWSIGTNWG